jgi:hypothetical protein
MLSYVFKHVSPKTTLKSSMEHQIITSSGAELDPAEFLFILSCSHLIRVDFMLKTFIFVPMMIASR